MRPVKKNIRVYELVIDDCSGTSDSLYKTVIPATSVKAARAFAAGNGEILHVKDITDESRVHIHTADVAVALEAAGYLPDKQR